MSRARAIAAGLAVALAIAVALATAGAGGAAGQRHTVVLDNAFGLTEDSDLRSSGVVVGRIESLSVQRGTARALATVEITRPSFAGFRADVFCEVRPQSLIGEYYLDCDPGSASAPAPRTIPVRQTAGTIPPDLVLDIMRRPERERFGIIVAELGAGVAARGEDLQASLRRAVPALRETERVLELLAANRRTLTALTRDADTVLAALAGNRRDVARFVAEAGDTAAASASRAGALRTTVARLPRFLRELRPALADLGTAAREQAPALRDLRAAAPRLTELVSLLGPFADSARPAVRGLGRAARTGSAAVREARSTVARLRDLASHSTEPLRNLRFVLEDVNDRGRATERNRLSPTGAGFTGLEAFLQYLFVQSQAINIYDSKGYILKLSVLLNECSRYTNAQTAREDPERTARCRQWLGPTQPGVTTGAVSRTTRDGARDADRSAPERAAPGAAGPGPAPGAPALPAPSGPRSPLPSPRELLDRVLPDVADRLPELLPRPRGEREDDGERSLLDYLLGS